MVGRGKPGQRAADDAQECRAEHVTDAGQAGDDRGVIVGPKDAGHLTIKVGELAVEVEHGLGESHNEGGGGCLAGNVGGLPAGGFDGGLGKPARAADSAPLQPSGQPPGTQLADRCRGLKAADEDQRAAVCEVQHSFQGRKDAGEQTAEAVDASGAVRGQIGTIRTQQLKLGDVLVVARADRASSGPDRR